MGLARGFPEAMGMWNIFVLWLRRVGIDWLGGLNGRRSRRQGLADTELRPPLTPNSFPLLVQKWTSGVRDWGHLLHAE